MAGRQAAQAGEATSIYCPPRDVEAMGRLARSWQTFKTSLRVARQDKELMWLPVLSFAAAAVALMGITGLGFASGVFPEVTRPDGGVDPVAAGIVFLGYLVLAFIQTYFYAAMVAGANERLGGGDPTVGSALRAANQRLGKIFAWSLVLATVNVLLQAAREVIARRSPALASLITGIAGTAWNLATYFVVPIIMFEEKGVGASLKRSGGLFKKTWGETVVGEMGIGFVASLIFIPVLLVALLLVAALSTLGLTGVVLGIIGALVLIVAFVALVTLVQAVYKTELYRFAAQGKQDPHFEALQLQQAFVGRR